MVLQYETFAMVAIAAIGALPDTITDRAVTGPLRRRASGETIRTFRHRRDGPRLESIGQRVGEFLGDHLDELADAEPAMPVDDRAADVWEPMIAIADLAGGDWPARARHAALCLTDSALADDVASSDTLTLLANCQEIFDLEDYDDRIPSKMLVNELRELHEAPWEGRSLDARSLSSMLRGFGIRPVDLRHNGRVLKGYLRKDFLDAWVRYLPDPEGAQQSQQPQQPW